MHRTQLYIQEDIFEKVQHYSKSLGISISEFIRTAIFHEIEKKSQDNLAQFFETFEPLESFRDVNTQKYVDELRSKSRLLND